MLLKYRYERLEIIHRSRDCCHDLVFLPINLQRVIQIYSDLIKNNHVLITGIDYFEIEEKDLSVFIRENNIPCVIRGAECIFYTNHEGLNKFLKHENILEMLHFSFCVINRDKFAQNYDEHLSGKKLSNILFDDILLAVDLGDNDSARLITKDKELVKLIIGESIKYFILNNSDENNYYLRKKRNHIKKMSGIHLKDIDSGIMEYIYSRTKDNGITMFVEELDVIGERIRLIIWIGNVIKKEYNDIIYDRREYFLLEYNINSMDWKILIEGIAEPPKAECIW